MNGKLSPLLGDDPIAAYWIGFLMADGCFTGVGGNRMKVALARKDHEHIVALAGWLGAGNVRQSGDKVSEMALVDHITVPQLREKFDIRPRKTYNPPRHLPFRDKTLLSCWLVGLIDGDGHIRKQTNRESAVMIMNVHLSWMDLLRSVSEALGMGSVGTRGGKYARLTIAKHSHLVTLKLLANTSGIPILQRKWERIDVDLIVDRYERAAEVKRLIRLGLSGKEIRDLTGASYSSITDQRRSMGLPRPGRWSTSSDRIGIL